MSPWGAYETVMPAVSLRTCVFRRPGGAGDVEDQVLAKERRSGSASRSTMAGSIGSPLPKIRSTAIYVLERGDWVERCYQETPAK